MIQREAHAGRPGIQPHREEVWRKYIFSYDLSIWASFNVKHKYNTMVQLGNSRLLEAFDDSIQFILQTVDMRGKNISIKT